MTDTAGDSRSTQRDPRTGPGRFAGWAVLLVLLGGVGGWALHTLLTPLAAVPPSPDYTLVAAREGSVGHSIRLNVRAEWTGGPTVLSGMSGIVTNVAVADGDRVESGDQIATVDLKPVVVADGDTPAFRDLAPGDTGPDVAQLQRMLRELGYPAEDSGTLDALTEDAVRQWQTARSMPDTGTVPLGTLLFAAGLPARILPDEEVTVGGQISAGQPLFTVLPEAPIFRINLPEGQTRIVEEGQEASLESTAGDWPARIGPIELSWTTGDYFTILHPTADNGLICSSDCDILPVRGPSLVPSTIQVEPEIDGIVVPASAIVTTADDQTAVVLPDGDVRGVRVLGGSFGTVVVEGLALGVQVRAPGLLPADLDAHTASQTTR